MATDKADTVAFVVDRPRVVNMPERLYLPRGLLGRIDCHVESNPPLTVIVWTKDGRLMDLEKARHIRVSRHGSLLVKPVSMFDEGEYSCTPYSPLGPGEPSIAVQVFVRGSLAILVYTKLLL